MKGKLGGKRVAFAVAAVAVAFLAYRHFKRAGQSSAVNSEVPLTPSPYFYADPFGGAGGGGSVGGGTASNPTPSVATTPTTTNRDVDSGVIQRLRKQKQQGGLQNPPPKQLSK